MNQILSTCTRRGRTDSQQLVVILQLPKSFTGPRADQAMHLRRRFAAGQRGLHPALAQFGGCFVFGTMDRDAREVPTD